MIDSSNIQKTLYAVIGKTYGKEWIYSLYMNEDTANKIAALFNKELNKLGYYCNGGHTFMETFEARIKFLSIDPDSYIWGATEYIVTPIEIEREVPFTQEQIDNVKLY